MNAAARNQPLDIALWLAVAILAPLLFVGGPGYYSPRSYQFAWQLGHPLFFFLVVAIGLRRAPALATGGWLRAAAASVLVTGLVGILIEWLQRWTGRDSNWADVRLDLLGAMIAVTCLAVSRSRFERFARGACAAAAISMLVLMDVRPLVTALVDEYQARRAFPVLADFSSPFELGRWTSRYPMAIVAAPEGGPGRVLGIELQPGRFSGFALRHFPGDWRGYGELSFGVYLSEDREVSLTCRIHDVDHNSNNRFSDRFNRSFPLERGWTRIRIPLAEVESAPRKRKMNMARIAGLGCFVSRLEQPLQVSVDALMLDRP